MQPLKLSRIETKSYFKKVAKDVVIIIRIPENKKCSNINIHKVQESSEDYQHLDFVFCLLQQEFVHRQNKKWIKAFLNCFYCERIIKTRAEFAGCFKCNIETATNRINIKLWHEKLNQA